MQKINGKTQMADVDVCITLNLERASQEVSSKFTSYFPLSNYKALNPFVCHFNNFKTYSIQ